MADFVSNFTNRLDAKGRVSVPAPFRAALSRENYEGVYCFPSAHLPAVDAGGNALLGEIQKRVDSFTTLTPQHDFVSMALFGVSENLKLDSDGRVILPETLRLHAGITDQVTFVGQGYKFQMWNPERFAEHRAEALRRALEVLSGEPQSAAQPAGASTLSATPSGSTG
ncbi:MraZ protein [Breoghania corrubedonensis]|uniref:Transcriptional regulator MraZ n=1 Tax=Breoghania corrubedonensis TaxID=665038 RepID=A0A2T5V4W8_9HYPH|nr:division/cell wall cluster transcriptional repressor MraZ [Breoghania corrubedonensis]PTW58817.1 MraZ protein [Breoghania corrubedonensis]